ncbi:hypothetical protein [Bacillus sp. SM2101]|uniref:hypothetical protein n=1 Tax=Bacillus sp. SM2101 TaxID=2805366 RepID=UPI001BDDE6F7|nr:hypothetical protein [Bacillus sp. SM2101]
MKRVAALAVQDARNIIKDPILVIAICFPFILGLTARFVLPVIHSWVLGTFQFDLSNHYPFIISLLLLMTPLWMGVLMGFILLDEKDEGVDLYFAVTPLTKSGYFMFRVFSPAVLTFFLSYIVIMLQGLVPWHVINFFPIAVMLALEAPLLSLIMVTVASNKVEGLAISKVLTLMFFTPVPPYIFHNSWTMLFGIVPFYWPAIIFMEDSNRVALLYAIGLLVHIIWLNIVMKKYLTRVS